MADNESNTTDTEVSALQDKYGFDLLYDPQSETFFLKRDGHYGDTEIIDQQAWSDQYLQNMIKVFSANVTDEQRKSPQDVNLDFAQALQIKDPQIIYEERDLYQSLQAEKPDLSLAFYDGANNITFIKYNVKPEEKEKCIELLQSKKGLSSELALKSIDRYTNPNISSIISRDLHEGGHLTDHLKSGNQQYNIHPEYMAKLDALSEIKSAMLQAGSALKEYEATGNLDAFDNISIKLEADNIKNALKENPNMENKAEFVAGYIYDKWLEVYNQPGSDYSEQMYRNSTPKNQNIDYPLWALDKSPAAHQEYLDRVESMFAEDIPGLGNVRKFIDPDFKLNDDVTQRLDRDCADVLGNGSLSKMAKDGHLGEYFEQVKEAYADGKLSPQEATQLGDFVEEHTNPIRYKLNKKSSLSDEALNQILEKSGRSGNPQPTSPTEEREPLKIQPAKMMSTNSQQAYNQSPQPTPEVPLQPQQTSTLEPQQTVSQNTPPQTVAPVTGVYPPISSMTLQQIGNLINKEYRLGNNPYSSGVKLADSATKAPRAQDNQISSPQITITGNTGNTGR